MAVREYIGARYVPLLADPVEWDSTREYEPLTIVIHQGNSFTSRQSVPVGIDILNEHYWAATGNYNAQTEAYRRETASVATGLQEVQHDIDDIDEAVAQVRLDVSANTLAIGNESQAREQADNAINDAIDDINALFPLQGSNIAPGAVGTDAIAAQAVTAPKYQDGSIGLIKLNENVQSRMRAESLRYATAVFIGDSYGRGVGSSDDHGWVHYCTSYLGLTGSQYVNVSNSGAGFVRTGHSDGLNGLTFETQLDYAANHLPTGKTANDITHVIIAGGYNDHGASGIPNAVTSCVNHAKSLFPDAAVFVLPLCAGDREITSEFNYLYSSIASGAARAGAATTDVSTYWLYPKQIETSYGDQIHPNDEGYKIQGRNIASFVMGGLVMPYAETFGASAEGYSVASGASSQGFRCGVNYGVAWFAGSFSRVGTGDLFTLPAYLRPTKTVYLYCFAYADTNHRGVARVRILGNGKVDFASLDFGTYDASLEYTVYLPFTSIILGHEWQ